VITFHWHSLLSPAVVYSKKKAPHWGEMRRLAEVSITGWRRCADCEEIHRLGLKNYRMVRSSTTWYQQTITAVLKSA